jgi:putative permease
MKILSDWFQRFFNDPQAVILTVVLVVGASIILIMGRDLAPVLASIVIAYLLEGVVRILQRWLRLPRLLATFVVFVLFSVLCCSCCSGCCRWFPGN